jgi:predicted nucleic acid-binding protein
MNSVVSDTTALIIFAKSDTLFLLSNLFEEIYIPQTVYDELVFKDDIVKFRIGKFDKISLKKVSNFKILKEIKKLNIDDGEIEAITLALELNLKLIIDERKGRKMAMNQGLKIVGVLGILIENYRQNFISFDDLHYCFELVKKNGLRISEELENIFYKELQG